MTQGNAKELNHALFSQVRQLCGEGDELALLEQYGKALSKYWEAWDLLPEPQTEWLAATWILAAIADANYRSGNYQAGRDHLLLAMHCPNAIENPFLHLRLGQCQYELGNLNCAIDELARAYMGAGKEIFEDEEEKYFELVKANLRPPLDGEW